MVFLSVTRLRIRSRRFLPAFLWHVFFVRRQVSRAPGGLGFRLDNEGPHVFWTLSAWKDEAAMRAFAEANKLKLGAVAQPLRVALTGRTTSPGIFEVLAVLGREECLARLADQATG